MTSDLPSLTVAWVALDHGVGGLEAGVGDLRHGELLVVGLLGGDDGSVGDQREVDPGVGHQVGLELGQVHVESSVKPQRGRDGGHDLPNQPVEVGVGTITEVYYIIPFFFADACCEASD